MGVRSIADDLGWVFEVQLEVDSSAAKAMASRTGLGKTRHIEVQYLWLQQMMKQDWLTIRKIRGDSNPSDVLTKPKALKEIMELMDGLGFCDPGESCRTDPGGSVRGGVPDIDHAVSDYKNKAY